MKRKHFFAVNGLFAIVAGIVGLSGIITTFDALARSAQEEQRAVGVVMDTQR